MEAAPPPASQSSGKGSGRHHDCEAPNRVLQMPFLLQLLRAHPFAGTGTFVGPVITVGTYFLDAWHLFHIGLPPQAIEGLGAAIFFLSIAGIVLYRWRPGNETNIPIMGISTRQTSAAAPPQQQKPQSIDIEVENEIEQWWRDHFHGSEVARHTPALNVAHAAKEDLKRRLRASRAITDRLMPDMSIAEAHSHLVATGRWEAGSDELWGELRQKARHGWMRVWGRPESAALERPYKPSEAITPEHWRDYGFDVLRCLQGGDERPCRSIPDDDRRHPVSKGYAELRVNRDQVRRVWPIPQA
jgi:hypothetical protein